MPHITLRRILHALLKLVVLLALGRAVQYIAWGFICAIWGILIDCSAARVALSMSRLDEMNAMRQRFRELNPTIYELLKISGTAGMSIGILHQNDICYTAHYGVRDTKKQIPLDEDTLYWAGSLSKSMTAAAVGMLVEDGKLRWESKISEILPDFQHQNDTVRKEATIKHLLSHTSGLGGKGGFWQRDHANIMISREAFLKTTTYLPAVHKLGSMWSPCNWNYGLADFVIEKSSGVSYGEFLEQRLFRPLGLTNTTMDVHPHMPNVAEAYLYAGETPHGVGKPQVGEGTIMAGAMGLKSSIKDLLLYARGLMNAVADQSQRKTTTTPGSPFSQAPHLFEPHIVISENDDGTPKEEFGLGWVRTHLPSTMSQVSINEGLVKQYPVIGRGLRDAPLVLYHAGSVVGYLTSVTLIPQSTSAIVVMSNTLANQDLPDWVGLLLLEALLNVPERVDLIPFAQEAADTWSKQFPTMQKTLDSGRMLDTQMQPPEAYIGLYYNAVGTWFFDIFQEYGNDCLWMAYCGDRDNKYCLKHYRHDTLTFEIDYDESNRRGLWPTPAADFYLLHFRQGNEKDGHMDSILWKADWEEPEGEVFKWQSRKATL